MFGSESDSESKSYAPKHWDGNNVVEGIEKKKHRVSLASILGTYRWVWMLSEEHQTEHIQVDDDEAGGHMTLQSSKERVHPSSVTGSFATGAMKGNIVALEKFTEDGSTVANTWKVIIEWEDDCPEEGHTLLVGQVKDEHGAPFLEVDVATGWVGCAETGFKLLGKKQEDEMCMEGLTEVDEMRLFMDIDEEEFIRISREQD